MKQIDQLEGTGPSAKVLPKGFRSNAREGFVHEDDVESPAILEELTRARASSIATELELFSEWIGLTEENTVAARKVLGDSLDVVKKAGAELRKRAPFARH